ncbi:MAG: chemotaxis protein MotB, partial [Bacillota bacterium]|nr:chemotaxis protein MotB [Bacillota bacterium]
VEGHTDNLPINTYRFPSNWELSTARATTVVRYLAEKHGIPPDRLSAAGYGEWRPVAPNDTPEHRAQNRRVDIVVLRTDLAKQEPLGGSAQKGGGGN